MYLNDTSTGSEAQTTHNIPGRPLRYREAVAKTERKLFKGYSRACAGVDVIEQLRREAVSPLERIHFCDREQL